MVCPVDIQSWPAGQPTWDGGLYLSAVNLSPKCHPGFSVYENRMPCTEHNQIVIVELIPS